MVWWGFYEEVMKTHDRANPTWSHANPISLNHRWLWVWRISKKYSVYIHYWWGRGCFGILNLEQFLEGFISLTPCVWSGAISVLDGRRVTVDYIHLRGSLLSFMAQGSRLSLASNDSLTRSWSKTASQANPFNFWTMILSTYPDSRLESNEPVPLVLNPAV